VTTSTMSSGYQFTRPQSTRLLGLGAMVEFYHKLQSKPNNSRV